MSNSDNYKKASQPVISEAPQKVLLRVITNDEMAEVFILNHKLDLVDRGVGRRYEKKLEPGIYKVKIRSGSQIKEELVTLTGGKGVFEMSFEPLTIVSAAPILDTAKTHEFHIGNAESLSKSTSFHATSGVGSSIFVFARCWTAIEKKNARHLVNNTARGLTLHDESGNLIADIERLASRSQKEWDPWAACLIKVNPGTYRLRLELANKSQIEQSIVTSANWQTQLFYLQRDYGNEKKSDWRADLAGGSILMSRKSDGFSAGQNNLRLDELARLALINNRQIISDEVRQQLLHGKFDNPMFGIYGAHLLLLSDDPDPALLNTIINNLRNIIGHDHPDVEALALRILGDTGYVCTIPPMLRRSWGIIVERTIARENLVPAGSLASNMATKIWGEEPFLLWQNRSPIENQDEEHESHFMDALIQRIRVSESRKQPVLASTMQDFHNRWEQTKTLESESFSDGLPSSCEGTEPSESQDVEDSSDAQREPNVESNYMDDNFSEVTLQPVTDTTAQMTPELVRTLGLPRSTVELMLGQVRPSDLD